MVGAPLRDVEDASDDVHGTSLIVNIVAVLPIAADGKPDPSKETTIAGCTDEADTRSTRGVWQTEYV